MRRAAPWLLGPCCGLVLLLVMYGPVLWNGELFAFRDSAYFYDPLYRRVHLEWQAGRWPLWDPWQNGGQPLLGNPAAAVLYPGKLVFAFGSHAWGMRLYVAGHSALACAGMLVLARSLGLSNAGAGIAGLTYAFGAPVLFQYCNVIYLVGAAWVPWGWWAALRLARRRRWALPGLAVALAMPLLGGDPQAAYLTLLTATGFLTLPALRRSWLRASPAAVRFGIAAVLGAWVVGVLALACCAPGLTQWRPAWLWWLAWGGAAGWGAWRCRSRLEGGLGRRLGALTAAGLLALTLAGAQVVPVAEFLAVGQVRGERFRSLRTRFSVEPYRVVEAVWPWVFGHPYPVDRSWIQAVPPRDDRQLWEPSLYVGGLSLLLALSAAGLRKGPSWRGWLTAVAVVGLVASLGPFGGPLWWARWLPGAVSMLGPHDPPGLSARADGWFSDAAGSPYELLAALVPGFGLFRYPAKLLTFSTAALAILASLGWDEVVAGRSRRFTWIGLAAAVVSLGAFALAWAFRGGAVAWIAGQHLGQADIGPVDPSGAWAQTQGACLHGLLVFGVGLALVVLARVRPALAGSLVLVVLTIDLGVANRRLIWTVPQPVMDAESEVARRIDAAEHESPSPGPFRVHRMAGWLPGQFREAGSPSRIRELIDWNRRTLQPLTGLPGGWSYCVTPGAIGLEDYQNLFLARIVPASEALARSLRIAPEQPVAYHARRAYDLWGARYFILPIQSAGWGTEERGFAAFLTNTEVIYPRPGDFAGGRDRLRAWTRREDWQLLRNTAAFPRAWIVHHARVSAPPADAQARAMLYPGDQFWSEPGLSVRDPHTTAWIETRDPASLRPYVSSVPVGPEEGVSVVRSDPLRVELAARLSRPGFVILAETDYPGWSLTIDGRPAPILRANRLMRAAALEAGRHLLVYTYRPLSFRLGLAASGLGLATILGLLLRPRLGKTAPRRQSTTCPAVFPDNPAEKLKFRCPK